MSELKVGDKIRVTELDTPNDHKYLKIGEEYEVVSVSHDGWPYISIPFDSSYLMTLEQVEKVDGLSFPEFAQKLLNGDFEEGAEVTAKDRDGDIETLYVGKNRYGYGLCDNTRVFSDNTSTAFPSKMNGTWSVKEESKEEPVKEMSIEELQKELGYKIKITE